MNPSKMPELSDVDGVIVHIGAGNCNELECYLKSRAEQIVLVEPDPMAARALRCCVQEDARIKLVEAAVGEKGDVSSLYRYNVRGISSTYQLASDQFKWPGLYEVARHTVEVLNISELLSNIELDSCKHHFLVVDIPGVKLHLIRKIFESCSSRCIHSITLIFETSLHKDEVYWDRVLSSIKQAGYYLYGISSNGGVKKYHIQLDMTLEENKKLKKEIRELKREKCKLEKELFTNNEFLEDKLKKLEDLVKKEAGNAVQQLEAYLSVQNFLNFGYYLPRMHGWPVSSDFSLYLVDMISSTDYDLVVEFGSGTSTVLMAKALDKISREGKRISDAPVYQVAFEHLDEYHAQTYQHLKKLGLENNVELELSPLEPYTAPDGNVYSYYSCHSALRRLIEKIDVDCPKVLIVVDGPPASTGKWARYPALPILIKILPHSDVDVLLDDYIRNDEKEVAAQWKRELEEQGIKPTLVVSKIEKHSLLMSFSLKSGMLGH